MGGVVCRPELGRHVDLYGIDLHEVVRVRARLGEVVALAVAQPRCAGEVHVVQLDLPIDANLKFPDLGGVVGKELKNVAELPLYLPLGLACGAVAVAFRASSRVLGAGFKRLENPPNTFSTSSSDGAFVGYPRVPRAWHAPLGGFVFGVASLLFPEVTYQGFDNVNSMLGADGGGLRTPYPPTLLLELVLAKLAATTLCRQSGLVGGVYAPSLFMGAALGSAYGALLTPVAVATGAVGLGAVAPPQAYALVGMAGVLAGICRVPLTAILLLFELTHDYRIIVPLMGTVGVASWVAGAAERGRSGPAGGAGGSVRADPGRWPQPGLQAGPVLGGIPGFTPGSAGGGGPVSQFFRRAVCPGLRRAKCTTQTIRVQEGEITCAGGGWLRS